jgi:5-methylcytosine-specific restriction endonuclease McrA
MIPVQYSTKSQLIVDTFEGQSEDQKSSKYWGDDTVVPVRAEIKNHYIATQEYVCVYCMRQIVTANNALWDAEHVISRENAPRFMFTPQNLAVSCRDCNIAKGRKEVRKTKKKGFPNKSKHYLIVHPHFDNYGDHIRWIGDICAPKSDKGVETQAMCGLTRFTAKLLGIDGALVQPGFDNYVGALLKAKNQIEARAALAAISVYVEHIPQE